MYVVVGTEPDLQKIIMLKVDDMITEDLQYFYIGSFFLNLLLFGLVAGLMEKQLKKNLLTPIINLTKQIKEPQVFFKTNQNLA
mgnify:CR=1 FL=1|jgi:hypothetical protein